MLSFKSNCVATFVGSLLNSRVYAQLLTYCLESSSRICVSVTDQR